MAKTASVNQQVIDLFRSNFDDLLYAVQQRNLIYNYNFIYYSNKVGSAYNHPDGWVYTDTGKSKDGTIGFDPVNECCVVKSSSSFDGYMKLSQAIHEFPRWKSKLHGKVVTAACHLNILNNINLSTITASLSDGITVNSMKINCKGKVILPLKLEIAPESKKIEISIESNAPNILLHISKVYANVGNIPIENLPCIVTGVIGERKQYISTENSPQKKYLCVMLQWSLVQNLVD